MFELHPQLAQDCVTVGDFPLSRLLLMNDAQYPWFILVPRRRDITELFELNRQDRDLLHIEVFLLVEALKDGFGADKMNVAALGNVVDQLHVHVIARYRDDPSWPAPVWGKLPAVPYDKGALQQRLDKLKAILGQDFNYAEADL